MAISDEDKLVLKETYLGDPYLNLRELADASKSICGVPVSYEALKIMSWAEGWGVEKKRLQLGKSGQPKDMADEADDLRLITYAQAMDPEVSHSPADLAALIRTWETIRVASPRRRSGKSSRQQQMDATKEARRLVAELREKRENAKTAS